MRNKNRDNEDNNYDYSPNELADLSQENPKEYRAVVHSNLDDGDTVEGWEKRNLEWAKECLADQRSRR